MKTILLKLSGPMQAWGTDSHFETRHTDNRPSKSGIIGLIAASLGYKREQDNEIRGLNELDFALRVDQIGTSLRDYHTVHKYKSNGAPDRTYVTNRHYIQDAVFVVGISHHDDVLIEKIAESIQKPYFQPFMGRRSLPLPADFYLGIVDKPIVDALKAVEWQASDWYRDKEIDKLTIYADARLINRASGRPRRDRVTSFSRKERKFDLRMESKFDITLSRSTGTDSRKTDDTPIGNGQTEHDAFENLKE